MSRPISEIVDDVLVSTGLEPIEQLFASTDETAREVVVALNETIAEIIEAHDWRAITRYFTMVGNGVIETVDLPADFIRMPKGARVWSDRIGGAYEQVVDADTWLGLETHYNSMILNGYIISDDQIALRPAPADQELVRFVYISELSVKNGNDLKTRFDNATDTWLLDDRLLRLALTYHLRMEQGLEAQYEFQKYQLALEKAISRDKGPRIIKQARGGGMDGVSISYVNPVIV